MPLPEKTLVTVPGATRPNYDAYSLVVRSSGDRLHIAGWMGDDPETGKIVEGGVGAQAVSCIDIVEGNGVFEHGLEL